LRYQSDTFRTDNADSFAAVRIVVCSDARYNNRYCCLIKLLLFLLEF
jgi:hypothetical protein